MDRSSALSRLVTLTAGLAPTGITTSADLQAARTALASSLIQHAVDPSIATIGLPTAPAALPSSDQLAALGHLLDTAIAAQVVTPVPLVFPRGLPAVTLGSPALTPASVAGMLPQSIGPFIDQIGGLHWFDIYPPVSQTAISRVLAAAPFLLLPLAVPSGSIPTTLQVAAGSLWIESQTLAPAAPAGGYVGIAISGGTLVFSSAATVSVNGLQVATTTTLTLTVTLAGQAGPVGGGAPGADGGAVVAKLPTEVTFIFTLLGAKVTGASNASLTVYGSPVSLKWEAAAPVYEPTLAQIFVPFQPQSATFATTSVLSTLFEPAGKAKIAGGAWALPVAVTSPEQLGTAATAGLLALLLEPGLRANWRGLTGGPAALGSVFLEGSGGMLSLVTTISNANQISAAIDLWPSTASPGARSSIDINFPKGALLYYTSIGSFSGASHVEILASGAFLVTHIDRPLAADGSRLGPSLPGTLTVYETSSVNGVVIAGQAPATGAQVAPMALALHNALLRTTPPTLLLIAGQFSATPTALDSGGLLLVFGLESVLPTLPDPYAANFLPVMPSEGAPAPITSASSAPSALLATVLWSSTAAAQLSFSDSALTLDELQIQGLTSSPAPQPVGSAGQQDAEWRSALAELFNETLGSQNPELFLLDVSSNIDQFGVAMSFPERPRTFALSASLTDVEPFAAPGGASPAGAQDEQTLSISGLDLVAPCLDLRVFTAPAVQWEPVVTIQNPKVEPSPFPSPAGFLDDGGPTLLGAADVTLVPVAPAPLLSQVVSAYESGKAGAAMLTLPFGMTAVVAVPPRPQIHTPLFQRPGLSTVQPTFTSQNMSGGNQVSLTSPDIFVRTTSAATSSLPGAAVQLRNLVDQSGNPVLDPRAPTPGGPGGLPLSVLGPDVDTVFNEEFAPGATRALVPLTRIDVSGYGASSFSAWTDPTAKIPAVVQARFNMLVGRANHEVVQIESILHPWCAIVVRTITIDRQDNGEVFRYDSGWVTVTPGTFGCPGITVHPGAVRGAYNIRNIRDTTQTFTSGGVELVGVYFDADIQIDGVLSGASDGLVPSSGQLGFVQIAPVGSPLTPGDLAKLITSEGALGGPVDCVISIGGTGQTMRLSRVEVGNAPHAGAAQTAEFAAAARGSVVLPQPGSWSVLARTDNVSEPTPIDPDLGVPLIQEGPAGSPVSTLPWRLAEPVDLWVPDSPSMDYCLLHTTDSTRMLFPRPQIAVGASAFTSDQLPLLADGFALMGATSVCPRQDSCLTFPNANYALQIAGAGAFTLANVPASFAPSQASRPLATSSAGTIGLEYADETGMPAQISVAITPNSWSVGLQSVNTRVDIEPFNGLMRTVGNVIASSGSGVAFQNAKLVLGSVLQPLEDLLDFLEKLGLPDPLAMSFSNAGWSQTYKLSAGIQFNSDMIPALAALLNTPLGTLHIVLKTGFGNSVSSVGGQGADDLLGTSSQWRYYFTFSGTVQVPVFPLVKAGGLVGFGIQINFPVGTTPQSEQLSFQLGVIITVGGDLIPGVLKLQASVSFAFTLVVGLGASTTITVGVALIISASGMILSGLIGITFTAEAAGNVTVTVPRSVQATFDVSVDVTLCWFLDVSFDESVQYTKSLP
jgi:hypothetical protein